MQSRHEQFKAQKLYLADNPNRSRKVLSIQEGILPFGDSTPITLQIFANDKVHLKGKNGCGKSTLLKTLLGELSLLSGELQVNTPLYYLDQHFGAVNPNLSLLENVMETCQEMTESEARTLLAGDRFSSRRCVSVGVRTKRWREDEARNADRQPSTLPAFAAA